MQHFHTNNPYEKEFGYSRAVRKGPFIYVSGTTSVDPISGQLHHAGSAYDQACAIFKEIVRAVEALGGQKSDIVRVRMFVAEDGDTGRVGTALKEALGDVSPAATMIVGARFVSSEMLVEIEADAVVMVKGFNFMTILQWFASGMYMYA
ncbi:YjgF-like protein [Earliella scabrosa]|nr:YjgF-like protein [Earliella scabrosa]